VCLTFSNNPDGDSLLVEGQKNAGPRSLPLPDRDQKTDPVHDGHGSAKIAVGVSRQGGRQIRRYCCSVTEPSLPDIRMAQADEQRRDAHPGARYLPSAQVLAELACLGPDLRRLAEDLRNRLSEAEVQ
jgi:hypothetical protein